MPPTRVALGLALLLCAAAPAQEPRPQPAAPPRDERLAGREALLHAYQKEYAFLESEETALQGRLAEVEADHARRVDGASKELSALEERLRAARADVEARRARLTKLEEQAARGDDAGDALEAVLSQAEAVVPAVDGAPLDRADDGAARVAAVDRALDAVTTALRERCGVRRAPGRFFLPDGSEATGDVVWVGAVACLGASPQAAGALSPAGAGAFQLWSREGEAQARAAASGALPLTLPLFLFESADKAADRRVESSAADTVRRGGEVAYVIVGLGAVCAVLVLLRVLILARASGSPDTTLAAVEPLLAAGRVDEARARCRGRRGVAARVVEAMLPHLREGDARLESAASERMLREAQGIERFETAILVTAAVAPLLGLLGTVTGMISTFDVITVHGTGDPKLLAGGISEALITTELGLMVAIPALLVGNMLATWTETLRAGMERAALRITLVAAETEQPVVLASESGRIPAPGAPDA